MERVRYNYFLLDTINEFGSFIEWATVKKLLFSEDI